MLRNRKSTNNDIYLHWQSFSLTIWKRGTLQTLVSRAFRACSNDQHLENEIKHFKKVFRNISGYPNWVIEQTIEKNEMARSTKNIRELSWMSDSASFSVFCKIGALERNAY